MPGPEQLPDDGRADEAGGAGHEDPHRYASSADSDAGSPSPRGARSLATQAGDAIKQKLSKFIPYLT